MSSYVYVRSEPSLWTVGFYKPGGAWEPESDHGSQKEAADRVVYLNGGQPGSMPAEQIRTFVGWFRHDQAEEPDDGALILRDEHRVYVRTDPPPNEKPRTINGHPMGDWWLLDGSKDGDGPLFFGEVMGLDDPECDRQFHSFERLYTADDIARVADEFLGG